MSAVERTNKVYGYNIVGRVHLIECDQRESLSEGNSLKLQHGQYRGGQGKNIVQ